MRKCRVCGVDIDEHRLASVVWRESVERLGRAEAEIERVRPVIDAAENVARHCDQTWEYVSGLIDELQAALSAYHADREVSL